MVGILSINRPEWVIVDFANILYRATTVPFYNTISNFGYAMNNSGVEVMFCSYDGLKKLQSL